MRIMIVGGAGYIGSSLTPLLIERGHKVTVVDLFWFGDNLPNECVKIRKDAKDLLPDDFAEIDTVVFLAGLSNDPMADFSPFENFVANGAIPAYVAYTAAKAGVKRFVHGGSCSVYGRATGIVDEFASPRTFSAYGISKLQGEVGCGQQAHNGMLVTNFRMGTVCGWSPRMRFDLIINTMVKDALTLRQITVNDPEALRPILDIRDAIRAYALAAEGRFPIGVINLVSENARVGTVAENVQRAIERYDGGKITIVTRGVQDIRSYAAQMKGQTWEVMGRKVTPISSTIDSVINGVDWATTNIGDPRFYNIETFKRLKETTLQAAA